MRKTLVKLVRYRWLMILALLFGLSSRVIAQSPFVIIVSPKSSRDSLSIKALQKIFKGLPIESNNPTLFQTVEFGPASDAFYEELYGLSAFAIGKHWLSLIFAGERVLPPKNFSEVSSLVEFFSRYDDAIGFLPRKEFLRLPRGALKAVVIGGLNYQNPQYSLKRTERPK